MCFELRTYKVKGVNMCPAQALFGGLLWGNNLMRFVFVDEAGTSDLEPVTVVVGLIVNADTQLMFAEAAVEEALMAIPEKYRNKKSFVFHSTEIWGSNKYRQGWSMADRLALLKTMMALPRRLKIPITMSMVRRSAPFDAHVNTPMSRSQFQHFMAFAGCMASADRYIRNYADPSEVAAVVAEDVPEMRQFLALAPSILRDKPITVGPEYLQRTAKEIELGHLTQSGDIRVSRIRSNIHFVSKGDKLLLLADACAFGFRRFLSEQSFGDDFVSAILGSPLNIEDYRGPSAFDNFYGHARSV